MKEGIFKKIAIGVAVSLASTAIIALVSGFFVSDSGGASTSNICVHKTRTTQNTEATCMVSGVNNRVRCLECGKIVSEGEEIPPIGHTGELGKECIVCGDDIYGATINSNIYTLEDVESGEKVTGNWYRLYFSYYQDGGYFVFKDGQGTDVTFHLSEYNSYITGPNQYSTNLIDYTFPSFLHDEGCSEDSRTIGYLDVYFKEGTVIDDGYPNGESYEVSNIIVDKDFSFVSHYISSDFSIKRIVFESN